jgi:hypothetical protein
VDLLAVFIRSGFRTTARRHRQPQEEDEGCCDEPPHRSPIHTHKRKEAVELVNSKRLPESFLADVAHDWDKWSVAWRRLGDRSCMDGPVVTRTQRGSRAAWLAGLAPSSLLPAAAA